MRKFLSSFIVFLAISTTSVAAAEQVSQDLPQQSVEKNISVKPPAILQKMTNGAGDS